MRDSSLTFANAVTRPHRMMSCVDVLFNRQTVASGIEVMGGQVTYDRTAARLARLDLELALDDLDLVPTGPDDWFTPYGFELLVKRGIVLDFVTEVETTTGTATARTFEDGTARTFEDGTARYLEGAPTITTTTTVAASEPELIPLGVFPIQVSRVDGVTLLTAVQAEDRSRLVSDARFESDYQVAAGTNYVDAIRDLIESRVAGLEFVFPSTEFTTPRLTFAAQSDPWQAAQRMAKSIGQALSFDGLGRATMRNEPSFANDPVAEISEGVNMVAAGLELSRASAYNKVVARSQNASTGEVFEGEAVDDDPTSPTFYSAVGFGLKPRFYYSEFIGSDAQATAAAESILAANLGVSRAFEFDSLVDPRLECGDVVLIRNTALAVDAPHILDALTVPLGPEEAMSGASRTRQET